MKLLKKVTGSFLVLIAIGIAIAIVATLPNNIEQCSIKFQESGTIGTAFLIGSLVGDAIFILIILFLVKRGLKLIRRVKKIDNPVDEIES